MMLSLVTDKRESASFWKPGKEMSYRNESNMGRVISESSRLLQGSLFPLHPGLLRSLLAKTN